ncbi:MAG: fibronectin type III domain-containing protein [Bacteroides sp.]|nr:fibronectin type III domain-containing protein [Ruminococcus flavefaciens]MCM1555604.1 fibronectin type III domain-containing protein [Bacteroides sp.]
MKRVALFFACLDLIWLGGMSVTQAQTAPETYPVSLYSLVTTETAPAHPADGWTEFQLPSSGNRDTITKTYLSADAAPVVIEKIENYMTVPVTVQLYEIGFDFPYGGRTMTHFGVTGNGLIYLGTSGTSDNVEKDITYTSSASTYNLADVIVARPLGDNQGYQNPTEPHFVADAQTKIGYYKAPDEDYLIIGIRDLLVSFTLYGQPGDETPTPDKDYNLRVTYDVILYNDGRVMLNPIDLKPQASDAGNGLLYFSFGMFGNSEDAVAATDWTGKSAVVESGYALNNMEVTAEAESSVLTFMLPQECTVPQDINASIQDSEVYSSDFSATLSISGADGWLVFVADNDDVAEKPVSGKSYSTGSWNAAPDEIDGFPVKIFGTNTMVSANGLSPESTSYIYIYPYNAQCLGGPVYAEDPIILPVTTVIGGPTVTVANTTENAVTFNFPDLNSETGILVGIARRDYRNEAYGSRYEITGISGKPHHIGDTLFHNPSTEFSNYSNQGPYLITTAHVGKVENGSLTIGDLKPGTPYYFYFWTATTGENQYSNEYVEKGVYTLATTPHTFTLATDRSPIQDESWLPAGWSSSPAMNSQFSAALFQIGNGMTAQGDPNELRTLGVRLTATGSDAARADAIMPAFLSTHPSFDILYRVNMQASSMMGSNLSQLGEGDTLSVWYREMGQNEWKLASSVTSEDGVWEYASDNYVTLKATVSNVPQDKAIQVRFMIRAIPGSMMSSKIFTLHHVTVEPHLNCAYPENISVIDSLTTHSKIGLSWTDNNTPAASVIYRYRTAGTDAWSEYFAASQPTSTLIRRLQQHTDYEIELQSVCRQDSSLVKTVSVQTLYGLPYQAAVTDLDEWPSDFSAWVGDLGDEIYPDTYHSGFNTERYSTEGHTAIGTSFETSDSKKWLMLPVISLEDMSAPAEYTFQYKAYYDNYATGTKDAVDPQSAFRVLILVSKDGQFSSSDIVDTLTVDTMKTAYQTYTVDLSQYTRQIHIALYAENENIDYSNPDYYEKQMQRMSTYFVIDSLQARYTAEIPCYEVEDINQYDLSTTGITLSWTGYSEEYGIILKNEDNNEIDTVYTKETTHTLTGLEPGTLYTYRIQGYCEEGHRSPSALSEEGFFNTRTACAAPTELQCTKTGSDYAELAWTAGADNDYFNLMYRENAEQKFDTLKATEPEYKLTSLKPETAYVWQLQAVCGSYLSNVVAGNNFTTAVVAIEQPARFANLKVGVDNGRIAIWNAGALTIDRVEMYGANGSLLYAEKFHTASNILLPRVNSGSGMVLVRIFSAGETAVYKIILR